MNKKIESELRLLESVWKEAASTPEKARAFLMGVGILGVDGRLAPDLRDPPLAPPPTPPRPGAG